MFVAAVAELFRYKLVNSVIIFACWNSFASLQLSRELSHHGIASITSCNATILNKVNNIHMQGVLVFSAGNNRFLEEVKPSQFAHWYKWLVVGDADPEAFKNARYDVDVTLLRYNTSVNYVQTNDDTSTYLQYNFAIEIQDIYVHPRDGISIHPWATWSKDAGLMISSKYEVERIRRRENLNNYPLSIITPIGTYTPESHKKSFKEYLKDITTPEKDSSIRIGYAMTSLMVEALNATEVLRDCSLWIDENHNDSMIKIIASGDGDIAGAILRLLPSRMKITDPVTYLWPFSVGFLYIADRDSSNNMFVEPFTPGVWLCCIGIGIILAVAQRVTAKKPMEKEAAYMDVLATWLQQGTTTRTFLFADSGWDDMEYLKRRKKNSKFYQEPSVGMELVRQGGTAYHAEYNHVYPRLNTFSDDQICKLDKVDTIPEIISWLVATKQGKWTEILRITATWIHESGLSKRLLYQIQVRPPECRAALLAERVKLGDIFPLLVLTSAGALLSFLLLGLEIMYAKWQKLQLVQDKRSIRNFSYLEE